MAMAWSAVDLKLAAFDSTVYKNVSSSAIIKTNVDISESILPCIFSKIAMINPMIATPST
jgi:hypothetical protein